MSAGVILFNTMPQFVIVILKKYDFMILRKTTRIIKSMAGL